MKNYIQIGKRITYLLRHNPEDLLMDKNKAQSNDIKVIENGLGG